jgi:hypothetical protein
MGYDRGRLMSNQQSCCVNAPGWLRVLRCSEVWVLPSEIRTINGFASKEPKLGGSIPILADVTICGLSVETKSSFMPHRPIS